MNSKLAQYQQEVIVHTLRACQIFVGLPSADLDSISALSVVKKLARGEYLFHEGTPSHGFYVVQNGAICAHRVSPAGKEQIICIFRAGESFAEASLATDHGYPADARALEPSRVILIQKSGFLNLLRRQPELALRMLGSMSSHLRVLVGQLEDLTLKDVETRLTSWLLRQCGNPESNQPATIDLKTTKRVLAAELGTVSETLSRSLAKLREQKYISIKGKAITVHSPGALSLLYRRNVGK